MVNWLPWKQATAQTQKPRTLTKYIFFKFVKKITCTDILLFCTWCLESLQLEDQKYVSLNIEKEVCFSLSDCEGSIDR